MQVKSLLPKLFVLLCWLIPIWIWFSFDYSSVPIDRDWARDLKEISNIHRGDLVWLGPWLNPGLHASSSYYYFFYPSLWLSHGNPLGMVYFNLAIFAVTLGLIGYLGFQRWGWSIGLGILILGLSPWALESAIHPGNGYTYVALVLAGIAWLWFKQKPIFVASALIGLASSFHPGAMILLPLLLPIYLGLLKQPFRLLLNLALLVLPWVPLIGYELITKGFITRQFLANPSSGSLEFGPSWSSLQAISAITGLPGLFWLFFLGFGIILVAYQARKKSRPELKQFLDSINFAYIWLLFLVLGLCLVTGLLQRYLYGLVAILQLLLIYRLSQTAWTRLFLAVYAASLLVAVADFEPRYIEASPHTTNLVVENGQSFLEARPELKTETLATLTIMSGDTLEPQADDYRSWLRFQGLDVVDVSHNGQAEYLVIFVEDQTFDWSDWSTWEVEQFGAKSLVDVVELTHGQAVIYQAVR